MQDVSPNNPCPFLRALVAAGFVDGHVVPLAKLSKTVDVETALPWIEQAMRIDPFSASRYETDLVRAFYAARRVDEAVDVLEGSTRTHYDTKLWRAVCYVEIGREEEAQIAIKEVLATRPHLTVGSVMEAQPWKKPQDAARVEAALSRAALPR